MIQFDFSLDVISQVINELDRAEKYIRIAIFQLHNQAIFDVLNKKLAQGISVEIFTLPYDSIHDDVRTRVTYQYQSVRPELKAGIPDRSAGIEGLVEFVDDRLPAEPAHCQQCQAESHPERRPAKIASFVAIKQGKQNH